MNAATLTPYEAACEFLRVIREGDYDPGDYDSYARWSLDGHAVARHSGWGVLVDYDEDPDDDEPVWLDSDWLKARGVTEDDLAEVCPLFTPGGYLSIPRTRFLDLLEATATTDAGEFCRIARIDRRDPEILHALHRVRLGIEAAEYGPLREAAHSTNSDYAIALLQTDLPLDDIMQLCALPPMPIEYALAMAGGAA